MAQYTLNVKFDNTQLQTLYDAGYKVCISKLVNGKYTVVWSGQTVSNSNVFQWTESYKIFAAAKFATGMLASATTTPVPIAFGQTTTVNPAGVMSPASGPRTGGTFSVENNWMPAYFGVSQLCGDKYQTVHVDPTLTLPGTESFTPITQLIVFLSKTYSTGTMFTKAQSVTFPVTYSGTTTQTISYVTDPDSPGGYSGVWINGSPDSTSSFSAASVPENAKALSLAVNNGTFSAPTPQTYSHEKGFEVLPHGRDAFKMAQLINYFVTEFKEATEAPKDKDAEGQKTPEKK